MWFFCCYYVSGWYVAVLMFTNSLWLHVMIGNVFDRLLIAVTLVTGIRTVSVIALHKECKVEFLARKRKLQLLCLMWKKAHGGEALEQRNVRTRGDLKIKFAKRRAKSSFYQKSPYYRGVSLWDIHDNNIQRLSTIKRFKHAIDKLPLICPT